MRVTQKALQLFFSLFSFSFSSPFLDRLAKVILRMFSNSLPRKPVTRIGLVSLSTLSNVSLVICLLLLEMRVVHDVPSALENLVISDLCDHLNIIHVFHDINSTLQLIANIRHKAGSQRKLSMIFIVYSIQAWMGIFWYMFQTSHVIFTCLPSDTW